MLSVPGQPASDAQLHTGRELVERHFLLQHERPEELAELEIDNMDPCLRTLLFTDGTVTRTLEVQTLNRVSIGVVHQTNCTAPPSASRYLQVDAGTDAVERRVRMCIGESQSPSVWAETYLIPERLPRGFLGLLSGTPEGIGESLQALMLESARDLLWFGLGTPPDWATESATPEALMRLYRVNTHGQPALLISEWFAVELDSGAYRLAGLD
jgi:chorismate-pyruvate lyase